MSDLALQLASTEELADELMRRCTGAVLLCQFRVAPQRTVELSRWTITPSEYHAVGLAADLHARILRSIAQDRRHAGTLAEAEERAAQAGPGITDVEPDGDDDGARP